MGEMSNFAGVTVNTKNEHKTKVSSAIHNVILISFQMQVPIILSEDDIKVAAMIIITLCLRLLLS